MNIRCALSKMDELYILLSTLKHKPGVLCLTETWYSYDAIPYQINDYKIFNVPRLSCHGGGLCVYAKDYFKATCYS